jgi:hypothetical protein
MITWHRCLYGLTWPSTQTGPSSLVSSEKLTKVNHCLFALLPDACAIAGYCHHVFIRMVYLVSIYELRKSCSIELWTITSPCLIPFWCVICYHLFCSLSWPPIYADAYAHDPHCHHFIFIRIGRMCLFSAKKQQLLLLLLLLLLLYSTTTTTTTSPPPPPPSSCRFIEFYYY